MKLGEFVLHEPAARSWLTETVAPTAAPGETASPPRLDVNQRTALGLTAAWRPAPTPDTQRTAATMLALAQTSIVGAITAPDRARIELADPTGDTPYRPRFLMHLTGGSPATSIRLATPSEDPPVLGTAAGVDAALGLLADAVRAGNKQLRRLETFTAPYLTAAIHQLERTVVEGQGETTDCGCGWPITVHDDEWMHVYNPRLTGSDDHDPRP